LKIEKNEATIWARVSQRHKDWFDEKKRELGTHGNKVLMAIFDMAMEAEKNVSKQDQPSGSSEKVKIRRKTCA
jgi:hypothetical protein